MLGLRGDESWECGVGASDLSEGGLHWPKGLLGEAAIELADLGRLGNETVIGRLRVIRLNLDRVSERRCGEQFLYVGGVAFD